MIRGGYYIKARKIQESKIAHLPPYIREIWDWLIKEANHKNKKTHGIEIKRGQCLRSYADIQEGLHWMIGYRKMKYSKSQCENAMKVLTREEMITTTRTTRGLIITICNYDNYQNPDNYESHNESHKRATREPQPPESINKNDKNDKNDKNENKDSDLVKTQSGDEIPKGESPKDKPVEIDISLHTILKEDFLRYYKGKTGDEYYWSAAEAKNLQLLISKIKFTLKNKGIEQANENVRKKFNSIIRTPNDWIQDKLDIKIINSQYNRINSEGKIGKPDLEKRIYKKIDISKL